GRKDDDRKDRGERKPRERHAKQSEAAAPDVAREEQPVAAETAVADAGERRARKEAIRSENSERQASPERKAAPDRNRNEQRAPERGDTRPQRDGNLPARHR
ncbi:MAG: ATP-dependent helicase, partial [Mesorhizobium sp.]